MPLTFRPYILKEEKGHQLEKVLTRSEEGVYNPNRENISFDKGIYNILLKQHERHLNGNLVLSKCSRTIKGTHNRESNK